MGQALGTVLSFCTPPRQGPGRERGTDNVEFESDDGTAVSGRTTTTTAAAAALLVPHQEQPRMVMDFEQDTCYACDIRFDVLVRRHHCRRCRNIYCQKCSSHTDRVLMYGEIRPVRVCHACAQATPAENHFVEWQVPLLVEGTTLVRQALLAPRQVHLRVTADLQAMEETEALRERASGGTTRRHRLDEVESVASVVAGGERGWGASGMAAAVVRVPGGVGGDGASALLVIRFKGKGQLKLEARNPAERDLWVSALGEAVRRHRARPLAAAVEEERWARKEKAANDVHKRLNAEKRRANEAARAKIALKYGLDPDKYVSRSRASVPHGGGTGPGSGREVANGGIGFDAGRGGGVLNGAGVKMLAAMAR